MKCPHCGAEQLPATVPLDGASIEPAATDAAASDRYRVVETIGRGGMGVVYRAEDNALGQTVALKSLPEAFASDPRRMERLLEEVRAAREVSHPNVCRVYDVSSYAGRTVLTMEFIEGETLAARIARKGRIPRDEAISLARQIALGLSAAHERGVLHRDLKPANVLVDERGIARITDFGLAVRAERLEGGISREGTPQYMAPEALEGREATVRSDLYSLGLVLFEMFTGSPAFPGRTVEEAIADRRTPVVPPSRLTRDLDAGTEALLLRCLQADPSARPASARAIAEALPSAGGTSPGLEVAQRRADRIAAFREELRDLRAAGVLRLAQDDIERVERFHTGVVGDLVRDFDVDVGDREKQLSLGMRVVSTLGAIALAASGFYFFYRIWGLIGFPTQVAILVGVPLLGLLATSVVSARDRSGHFAAMVAAFALASFIAGSSVLSRIVNAPPSPHALGAWSALAFVLAYAHRLRLPLAAGIVLGAAFVSAVLPHAAGLDWTEFGQRPEGLILGGLLAFAAPALGAARRYPPFAPVFRLVGAVLALWATFVVSVNPALSYLPLAPGAEKVVFPLAAFGAAAAAIAAGVTLRYRETVYVGFLFFVTQMFVRAFDWCWSWMPKYLFFLLLAGLALAVLIALRRLRRFLSAQWDEVRP